ncbi:uncharacterized protein B0H18DRAFT_885970, partial [Fomitopsis serialis]|uniref:uncharacterized protein n=1 Tax=Fomitopsis serialis TaxID=139415 RepID=UPI002008B30D
TLRTWLDFPTKTASYLRSLFIRAIISAFRTSDVLLLDGVWDIYLRAEASLLLPHERHRLVSSNRLDMFYYDLCRAPSSLSANLTKSSSVLQRWCAQNDDKRLPFRELARGRRAVTSPSGPFHPDNIGKVGAIASGILHRCITFGAKASYLSPNFFPSLKDFKKLVAAHPEDYLCDKSCYGTHQPQRGPQHAEAYFAAEPHFREFFHAHPVAFMDARQEFLAECRTGAIQRKHLPSSGPLTSTLLAADFAYAGKVKMPTVEEMGEVVWNLKAGAFAGLACLGLISGKSATQDEVCKAFKLAHDHLEAKLSADVKSKIVFDPVMVEHTLCKVKRAGKKVPF